jgi:hypothetical protein
MTDEFDKLGPKDFVVGCLAVMAALILVPLLVVIFKISVYLAIVIGVIAAVILGTALLGKVIRLILQRQSRDKDNFPG